MLWILFGLGSRCADGAGGTLSASCPDIITDSCLSLLPPPKLPPKGGSTEASSRGTHDTCLAVLQHAGTFGASLSLQKDYLEV